MLGIDVGWSEKRKSSAVCRLSWDAESIDWTISRFRAVDTDRQKTITDVAGQAELLAVAIDGPLQRRFEMIGRYRSAERILSRGDLLKRIGKPGQSSSPNGAELNKQANESAKYVKDCCTVCKATHPERIDEVAIVEAFPTTFLGVMIRDPGRLSEARSDRYFAQLDGYVSSDDELLKFVERLLGARRRNKHFRLVTDHEERAALVCALTALCIALGKYTAVGDCRDGWIILPPK